MGSAQPRRTCGDASAFAGDACYRAVAPLKRGAGLDEPPEI